MNASQIAAIRTALDNPLTSEEVCRRVFEAVLQSARDDVSDTVLEAGRTVLRVDDLDPTDDEVLDTFDAMLAALLAE